MCKTKADFKALTRRMVDLVGGPELAATICGVSVAMISIWTRDENERLIPIDRNERLNEASGDMYLEELAHSRGYALVPLKERPDETASVLRTIAQFSRHAGQLDCTTLEAVEDGVLTPSEKRKIRDDIAPVKNIISQLEGVLK